MGHPGCDYCGEAGARSTPYKDGTATVYAHPKCRDKATGMVTVKLSHEDVEFIVDSLQERRREAETEHKRIRREAEEGHYDQEDIEYSAAFIAKLKVAEDRLVHRLRS